MSEYRDFDASRRERARGKEPITFTLGGETFETPGVLPGGAVMDLINTRSLYDGCREFMRAILRGDDAERGDDGEVTRASSVARFETLIYRLDDAIDVEAIIEVVDWLSSIYTGRPTPRSSASADGPHTNGQSSRVVSLSSASPTLEESSEP